jgi:hypothetical protein
LAIAAAMALSVAGTASAHDEKHKNLKIIKGGGKDVEAGMKLFSKGLGVKCNACHVKGEFDSDKVVEKEKARDFLKVTVGEKDAAKRGEALKALLDAMKLKEAKSADEVWKGIDMFTKL